MRLWRLLRRRREHEHDGPLVYGLRGWVLICDECGEHIVYGRNHE